MQNPYTIIKTKFGNYKCHEYRIKNNLVYFNGRAVRLPTVISITLKDGSVAYENRAVTTVKQDKAEAIIKVTKPRSRKPKTVSARVPEVIQI